VAHPARNAMKSGDAIDGPARGSATVLIMVLTRWPRIAVALAAGTAALAALTACTASATPTTTAYTATQSGSPVSLGLDTPAMVNTALPAALKAYIAAKGGHAAVDVVDRTTGATVAVNEDRTFQTASIMKFDILATRLLQTQKAGETLSSGQRGQAFLMITQSNNQAASSLYADDHTASGVSAANATFGLKNTHPGLNGVWGKTHTTAADQIRLLSAVFNPKGPLSSANQQYMMSLMAKVEPDQAWGITAAKTSDATGVYVKNGWDEMDAFGHMEGDNSIGRIVEPGHDWMIATMSNYNRTDTAGEKILGNLAKMAVGGLRLQTQPAN
jgi:beta-lactamase class A